MKQWHTQPPEKPKVVHLLNLLANKTDPIFSDRHETTDELIYFRKKIYSLSHVMLRHRFLWDVDGSTYKKTYAEKYGRAPPSTLCKDELILMTVNYNELQWILSHILDFSISTEKERELVGGMLIDNRDKREKDCMDRTPTIWDTPYHTEDYTIPFDRHLDVDKYGPYFLSNRDPVKDWGIVRHKNARIPDTWICCGQHIDHPGCWYGNTKEEYIHYNAFPDILSNQFVQAVVEQNRAKIQKIWEINPKIETMWLYKPYYENLHQKVLDSKASINLYDFIDYVVQLPQKNNRKFRTVIDALYNMAVLQSEFNEVFCKQRISSLVDYNNKKAFVDYNIFNLRKIKTEWNKGITINGKFYQSSLFADLSKKENVEKLINELGDQEPDFVKLLNLMIDVNDATKGWTNFRYLPDNVPEMYFRQRSIFLHDANERKSAELKEYNKDINRIISSINDSYRMQRKPMFQQFDKQLDYHLRTILSINIFVYDNKVEDVGPQFDDDIKEGIDLYNSVTSMKLQVKKSELRKYIETIIIDPTFIDLAFTSVYKDAKIIATEIEKLDANIDLEGRIHRALIRSSPEEYSPDLKSEVTKHFNIQEQLERDRAAIDEKNEIEKLKKAYTIYLENAEKESKRREEIAKLEAKKRAEAEELRLEKLKAQQETERREKVEQAKILQEEKERIEEVKKQKKINETKQIGKYRDFKVSKLPPGKSSAPFATGYFKWLDNSCPIDTMFTALFKNANSWFENKIRNTTIVELRSSCKNPDDVHKSIASDIDILHGEIQKVCSTVGEKTACFRYQNLNKDVSNPELTYINLKYMYGAVDQLPLPIIVDSLAFPTEFDAKGAEIIPLQYETYESEIEGRVLIGVDGVNFQDYVENEEYAGILILYNEDFTQYTNNSYEIGQGDAIIRPYRSDGDKGELPMANQKAFVLGIPMGTEDTDYGKDAKRLILNQALAKILNFIVLNKIQRVIYNIDLDTGRIGVVKGLPDDINAPILVRTWMKANFENRFFYSTRELVLKKTILGEYPIDNIFTNQLPLQLSNDRLKDPDIKQTYDEIKEILNSDGNLFVLTAVIMMRTGHYTVMVQELVTGDWWYYDALDKDAHQQTDTNFALRTVMINNIRHTPVYWIYTKQPMPTTFVHEETLEELVRALSSSEGFQPIGKLQKLFVIDKAVLVLAKSMRDDKKRVESLALSLLEPKNERKHLAMAQLEYETYEPKPIVNRNTDILYDPKFSLSTSTKEARYVWEVYLGDATYEKTKFDNITKTLPLRFQRDIPEELLKAPNDSNNERRYQAYMYALFMLLNKVSKPADENIRKALATAQV